MNTPIFKKSASNISNMGKVNRLILVLSKIIVGITKRRICVNVFNPNFSFVRLPKQLHFISLSSFIEYSETAKNINDKVKIDTKPKYSVTSLIKRKTIRISIIGITTEIYNEK